jgi:hypothetical protein
MVKIEKTKSLGFLAVQKMKRARTSSGDSIPKEEYLEQLKDERVSSNLVV